MEVADVDGDGDADIIVANDGAPNVVYFQAGVNTGTFLTATQIGGAAFDVTSRTTKVVAADLDKDGKVDLVVANRDEENLIFLAKDAPGGVLDNGRACPMRPPAPSRCPTTRATFTNSWPPTASSAPSGRKA